MGTISCSVSQRCTFSIPSKRPPTVILLLRTLCSPQQCEKGIAQSGRKQGACLPPCTPHSNPLFLLLPLHHSFQTGTVQRFFFVVVFSGSFVFADIHEIRSNQSSATTFAVVCYSHKVAIILFFFFLLPSFVSTSEWEFWFNLQLSSSYFLSLFCLLLPMKYFLSPLSQNYFLPHLYKCCIIFPSLNLL